MGRMKADEPDLKHFAFTGSMLPQIFLTFNWSMARQIIMLYQRSAVPVPEGISARRRLLSDTSSAVQTTPGVAAVFTFAGEDKPLCVLVDGNRRYRTGGLKRVFMLTPEESYECVTEGREYLDSPAPSEKAAIEPAVDETTAHLQSWLEEAAK